MKVLSEKNKQLREEAAMEGAPTPVAHGIKQEPRHTKKESTTLEEQLELVGLGGADLDDLERAKNEVDEEVFGSDSDSDSEDSDGGQRKKGNMFNTLFSKMGKKKPRNPDGNLWDSDDEDDNAHRREGL